MEHEPVNEQIKSLLEEVPAEYSYPWTINRPSAETHTGGDWYRILLATALNFKALHGANTSPTNEVLFKANQVMSEAGEYGLLQWDDETEFPDLLGDDVSDKFYKHHMYRGTVTMSGSVLAYETGLWEPGARKRARSSALLAAGMHVHGVPLTEAVAIVGKILGEPMDAEAVLGAIVPASHLKREIVLVSKANHRVFSRGTIQGGLIWQDSALNTSSQFRNVAFDWGRVTALARYIGEANVQCCPQFRAVAKRHGIPYILVRSAWAYVSENDYRLNVDDFKDVPALNCAQYGIPSIQGVFAGHEQDVMMAITRSSLKNCLAPENDSFKAYVDMLNNAKKRKRTFTRIKAATLAEASDRQATEHRITAADARDLVEGTRAARQAFLNAIISRRATDPSLDNLLKKISKLDCDNQAYYSLIDSASNVIYSQQMWILAKAMAENMIYNDPEGNENEKEMGIASLTIRLARMKEDIFGHYSHLSASFAMANSQLSANRARTVKYAKETEGKSTDLLLTQRSLVGHQIRSVMDAVNHIGTRASDLIPDLNTRVALMYKKWMVEGVAHETACVRVEGAYCGFVWKALELLTPAICLSRANGYIEGTQPNKSFIYDAVVELSQIWPHDLPVLQRFAYTGGEQLARDIDITCKLDYSVLNCFLRTVELLDVVIGDLMVGKTWEPDASWFDKFVMENGPPLSPGYDTSMLVEQEQLTIMEALMRQVEEERDTTWQENYEACLNSYPSEAVAQRYARVMGYADLRAAYAVLGLDAYYSESSQFVMNAQTKLALGGTLDEDGSSSTSGSFVSLM